MLPRTPYLKWLFLDLNAYFASVEQQAEQRLRGRPVGVLPLQSETTCIIAASYEAKARGVKTGTPVWEARRLCPGIILVPARHELYVDYHHRILKEINNHIPVSRVGSIDEMACELLGDEREPERALALARRLKRGLLDNVGECLRCSIGIAPSRFAAKVASDMRKPDGLVLIRPEELPERFFGLELRDLAGIGPNMERRLNAAGVHSVRALTALQPKHARKIWGSVAGERFWYGLHGVDIPEAPPAAKRSIGHSRILPPAMRAPDEARQVARRLLAKAAGRLRRYGLSASALACSARLETGLRWGGETRLEATQDSFALLAAFEALWRDYRPVGGSGRVKKVSVMLLGLVPLEQQAPDLFAAAEPGRQQRQQIRTSLAGALDRLNGKYGSDTVTLGLLPKIGLEYAGAKVAFTRIPDPEEFSE